MSALQLLGKQTVAGYEFTGIEGGFGEDKKVMLVKEIAEIHGQPLGEVNRRINDNRKRFNDDVDIIDLKANGLNPLGHDDLGYTKQSFNQSKNVYLLSERGYAKLLKILEDDTAWELYDQFVDGYFNMRQQLSLEDRLVLKIYKSESPMERVEAAKELTDLKIQEAVTPLLPKVQVHDQIVDASNLVSVNKVAKNIGIGEKKFFEFLRVVKVFYKEGNTNLPFQKYQNNGNFEVKTGTNVDKDGNSHITHTPKVTGKGEVFLLNLVNKFGGAKKINSLKMKDIAEYINNYNVIPMVVE